MRRAAVLAGGWLGCAALAAAVQTPSQTPATSRIQTPPVFTGRVDLVTLDVSVLDSHRLPVRGLTAADFVVKEDGKPQRVMALQEVDMDDPPPPPVAWMRDVTPDVTTNAWEDARLVVIVIDDALIPMDPFIIRNAKAIITRVIEKLGPRDLTAIVFTADNRKAQDFTHDRTALLAALDNFSPGLATWKFGTDTGGSGPNTDAHYYESSVKTLTRVAENLMARRDRRKTLIWVSPGIPADLEGSAPASIMPPGATTPVSMANHDIMAQLMEDMRKLMSRASLANVVIDPIDPTGLGGLEIYITGKVGSGDRHAMLAQDFLETAAANTGGHAIVNTNDPGPGIDRIFQENSSYYLLGFEPQNTKQDGTFRRIEVQVDRPGVDVRTGTGYYADRPEDKATAAKNTKISPEDAALAQAIGSVVPAPDLPLRVAIAPFAAPGRHTAIVTIAMGVEQPIPSEAARARLTETTELQISAFTPEGDPRGTQRSTAHVVLRPGSTGDADYEVLGRIDLAAGRYALRLAAHNATSQKTGSVAASVTVPDFNTDAFSISGVVVSRAPGRVAAPVDLFTAILPILPTADRDFAASDRADVFLRLYQSGKKPIADVSLATRILDDHGADNVRETRTLDAGQFVALAEPTALGVPPPAARIGGQRPERPDAFANEWLKAADVRYAIPLATLTAGEHLLTFEATIGATTLRRDVRFSVKWTRDPGAGWPSQ